MPGRARASGFVQDVLDLEQVLGNLEALRRDVEPRGPSILDLMDQPGLLENVELVRHTRIPDDFLVQIGLGTATVISEVHQNRQRVRVSEDFDLFVLYDYHMLYCLLILIHYSPTEVKFLTSP